MTLTASNESYRTHTCGQLTEMNDGETVRLAGWLNARRNHGNIIFFELRDQSGITQFVAQKENPVFDEISNLNLESVLVVEGVVRSRLPGKQNNAVSTGKIEVDATATEILSEASPLPFQLTDKNVNDDKRLEYRFLDLRRKEMQENIALRGAVIDTMRAEMKKAGFQELQTPILAASSPEGARDFLVPSRLNKGEFYALPQAPQQFKQLAMMSGIDKYFQIAPCFRDEDARAGP